MQLHAEGRGHLAEGSSSVAKRCLHAPSFTVLKRSEARIFMIVYSAALTIVAGKIKKLAGGAAGAGRRWLRRWRSQTQALTAQEATFEGRGEREEISLRQYVLRDHQIRSGSGLFIHSASTHHYTNRVSNRSVGQAPRLHRRIWQRCR